MKRLMVLAGCLLLLPVLGDVSAQSAHNLAAAGGARFVGTWKLLYRDTPGRSGGSAHTIETGRLTYDEQGNMTVQVAREGRDTLTAASEPQQVLSTYTAYWGTYVVDESKGNDDAPDRRLAVAGDDRASLTTSLRVLERWPAAGADLAGIDVDLGASTVTAAAAPPGRHGQFAKCWRMKKSATRQLVNGFSARSIRQKSRWMSVRPSLVDVASSVASNAFQSSVTSGGESPVASATLPAISA